MHRTTWKGVLSPAAEARLERSDARRDGDDLSHVCQQQAYVLLDGVLLMLRAASPAALTCSIHHGNRSSDPADVKLLIGHDMSSFCK